MMSIMLILLVLPCLASSRSYIRQLNPKSQKVYLDTDALLDDAKALLIALCHPNVDVVGIGTLRASRDVSLDQVVANVNRLLRLVKKTNIPIYRGSDDPIIPVEHNESATFVYGSDGFGDKPYVEPKLTDADFKAAVPGLHAALALSKLTKKFPGEITVIALGPVTNIALAIKLDADIVSRIKRVVIMGGSLSGGNVENSTAEFNFYLDPEAAHILLKQMTTPVVIVTWEMCIHTDSSVDIESHLHLDAPVSKFLNNVMEKTSKFVHQQTIEKNFTFAFCDKVAVAEGIGELNVLKKDDVHAEVLLSEGRDRGALVVELSTNKLKNAEVIMDYDVKKFHDLMIETVSYKPK